MLLLFQIKTQVRLEETETSVDFATLFSDCYDSFNAKTQAFVTIHILFVTLLQLLIENGLHMDQASQKVVCKRKGQETVQQVVAIESDILEDCVPCLEPGDDFNEITTATNTTMLALISSAIHYD